MLGCFPKSCNFYIRYTVSGVRVEVKDRQRLYCSFADWSKVHFKKSQSMSLGSCSVCCGLSLGILTFQLNHRPRLCYMCFCCILIQKLILKCIWFHCICMLESTVLLPSLIGFLVSSMLFFCFHAYRYTHFPIYTPSVFIALCFFVSHYLKVKLLCLLYSSWIFFNM